MVAEVGVGLVDGPHVFDDADHVIPIEHLLGRIDDTSDRIEAGPV
jgi:hypothetical protein